MHRLSKHHVTIMKLIFLAAGTQEETHTPLIIGLAVGLSLGMILIVAIIVCYRRKRASYHYNVFYDEQNIVMNAFDSK